MRRVVGAVLVVVAVVTWNAVDAWLLRPPPEHAATVFEVSDPPPPSPAATTRPGQPPASFRTAPLVFLSNAPAESLDCLPGIGPVLAQRIIAVRTSRGPFASWADLRAVKGIGARTVLRLRSLAGQ